MLQEAFFSSITNQFESKLPFVAYRKPEDDKISAILQNDSRLHRCDDYKEIGFVFAPFHNTDKPIIFPLDQSKEISTDHTIINQPQASTNMDSEDSSERLEHLALVQKGIQHIEEGLLEKVVLSRAINLSKPNLDTISLFKALLSTYPNAMVYLWFHPAIGLWLGATPETLLKLEGKRFKTMSLAGTQAFQGTLDVKWDDKNIDEQKIVTSYINDVLEPFSTHLSTSPLQTIRAGELLHLRSEISGILKDDISEALINNLHPTPAVCGLPRNLARDFILANENYEREYYTGFLGELNFKTSKARNRNQRNVENNAYSAIKRSTDLYVNLRCMQLAEDQVSIYVGGGITRDSNPEMEWKETVNKAQTMMRVVY